MNVRSLQPISEQFIRVSILERRVLTKFKVKVTCCTQIATQDQFGCMVHVKKRAPLKMKDLSHLVVVAWRAPSQSEASTLCSVHAGCSQL